MQMSTPPEPTRLIIPYGPSPHKTSEPHPTYIYCTHKQKNIRERLFLKAWYTLKDQNTGNDHIEIPAVYN